MPSMKVPLEVYPLFFMMATALTFGGYVAQKEIRSGEDLRLGSMLYNPDTHWQGRIDRKPSERQPFGNYFYRHIKD
ncbi:hypothetical protein BCR33DRAFT_711300 [Rhizoclosmatium globosum]|uniref:Uncharacterized protein n=1 Tax=Rhizoclosmatium globosum TaxID=329046 RepID=A0A1Y2D0U8_9FUNG|nr:hypothetical protein HDU99_006210 [Rhizoclosmatium hyalinum]KAJ3285733.1 hypothetical protein HDU79_007099 [Rhizoclosmatium sp. JEL0117]ORY52880.1 hypothetical protein BCR33DRAFT_711300 [Rhizoclosmatium globosum]|eukprot:ORY52880.1 hypothetical protein BCR33DRAFT_711300 [Rhizoclosmatium globosum]